MLGLPRFFEAKSPAPRWQKRTFELRRYNENADNKYYVNFCHLSEIINGKRGITAETAWLFSDALGTSPQFWMNLQAIRAADWINFTYP